KPQEQCFSGSVFSKQYWTEVVATACYTQNKSTIVKRHLKTPYEIFHGRIPNIDFLYVFGCQVYIHNHKDYLGKFDEKADDDYLLGYSLVSKTFRFFNTRRQPTEETYHITFNESTYASKFTKPLVDNFNIVESDRYPLDEYLHPYEPSQRYQTNSNNVSFIEPHERPDLVVLKTEFDHSNHNNDDPIIDNLTNTKDVQNPEPTSSLIEDASVLNTISIQTTTIPSSSIPSMASLVPQDRWSQDKHIELVNSIAKYCYSARDDVLTRNIPDSTCYNVRSRYPLDEYLHPYEPSQRYQTNSNDVSFIEPYERPDPVVLKTEVPSDQNDQTDHNNQNDHPAQTDEIFNDNQSDHSNHNNDDPIIDNLTNTKDVQNPEPTSSLDEDSLILNIIAITIVPSSSIPSMGSLVPQDRWSQDKHIELVNNIGNLGAGILTRAMAKELSAASAHECLFVDFLSEKESKKVSEALKHPG
ncbi:retrovirus-related pol polyprotein from transposon TNT 1-94, partial [Tanacetum coccineum]